MVWEEDLPTLDEIEVVLWWGVRMDVPHFEAPSVWVSVLPGTPLATPITLKAHSAETVRQFFPEPLLESAGSLDLFVSHALVDAPDRRIPPEASPAYGKFVALAQWLDLDHKAAAEVIGVSRGAVYSWRKGREPRRAKARRLHQLHAFLEALVARIGQQEAMSWLNASDPSPRDLLLSGDLSGAQKAAHETLFGRRRGPTPGAWVPQEDETPQSQEADADDHAGREPGMA